MDAGLYSLFLAVAVTLIALGGLPNLAYSAKMAIAVLGAVSGVIAAVLALMVVVD